MIAILGVGMTIVSVLFATPLSKIFISEDGELLRLTARGFRIYAISFLLCGFNIFGSAFFTALSNGVLSLLISFSRTFLLQVIAVFTLPIWMGVDGIWLATGVVEFLAFLLVVTLLVTQRKKYGYL